MGFVHVSATPDPTTDRARTDGSRAPFVGSVTRMVEGNAFLVATLAVCSGLLVALIRSALQADGWYTLVSGRLIAHSGIPHHDTLTALTLGRTWVDQQWLAHVALYALWAMGGVRAVLLATVVLYALAFTIVAVGARRRGATDRSVAIVVAVCFFVGISNTLLRAQVPAYVLFAVVLALLLSDAAQPGNRVYLVLPLLALWANVHGSVVLGAALVAAYGATVAVSGLLGRGDGERRLLRAAVLIAAPWACILASPYGLALPGYYRRVLDNPTLSHSVTEWGPSTIRGQPVFFAALLGGAILAVLARRRLTPFALVALVITALFGLLAIRNIVWFAFVGAAVLPTALDAVWAPAETRRRTGFNLLLGVAGLGLLVAAVAVTLARGNAWYQSSFPPRAIAAVHSATRADPRARVFADDQFADWLLFEDPSLAGRVAYDIRFELLTSRELRRIVDFRLERGLDWQRALAGYKVLVLDPKSDRGALEWLRRHARVHALYRDPNVVVLQRLSR
jgi:hypothetical protein